MNAPKIPMTTRVHDVLKQATHRMSKKQILAQIPIVTSQESVAAALNALRTEKLVDSALGGDIKKPRELVYWAVMPKEAEIKEQARNLTQEIIAVVKQHGNGGYMTAVDIAEHISPRVSPRTISQRLSSMAPRHLERTNIESGKPGPAGRSYVAHYRMPVAKQEAPQPIESEGGHADIVDAEFTVGNGPSEIFDMTTEGKLPFIIAPLADDGGFKSVIDDIRHVCDAEGVELSMLAQHLRFERAQLKLRSAGLTEVEVALTAAGADLKNQTPAEAVAALVDAIKALRMANAIATQGNAAPLSLTETDAIKNVRAFTSLQHLLQETGASLTLHDGGTTAEVVFRHGAESRVVQPGHEFLRLCDALRVINDLPAPSKLAA